MTGAILCGLFIFIIQPKHDSNSQYSESKIKQISYALSQRYLGDIDDQKLTDGIYMGYMSGLEDSSTRYLNKDQLQAAKALSEGQYIGTGLKFEWGIDGSYIIITEVIPDSPAALENIKVGDKITQIDGINVKTSNQMQIYEKLGYTGDKPVNYTLAHNNGQNKRDIKLVSKIVDIDAIHYEILDKVIGYISIVSVKDNMSEQIQKIIKQFETQGINKLILDIRDTYSDNIDEVYKLCDLFIDEQVVFKVKDKAGQMKEYKAQKGAYQGELVVLTNGGTQGCIEAFPAAIQELGQGITLGEATAGTGSVHQMITLEDQTGVIVSTGIIYTPKGIALKGKGVMPQKIVKPKMSSIIERLTTGQLEQRNDFQIMEAIRQLDLKQ